MNLRIIVRLFLVIATMSLAACDGGSSDQQVFRENAQNIPPVAAFSTSVTQGKNPLLNVQFDATQSFDANGSIVNFEWDFGDGELASGANQSTPLHSFINAGNYTVTLTVTDNDNATNSNVASQVISVLPNQPPVASFAWTIETDGLTANFNAALSSDSDGTISLYAWDLGEIGRAHV